MGAKSAKPLQFNQNSALREFSSNGSTNNRKVPTTNYNPNRRRISKTRTISNNSANSINSIDEIETPNSKYNDYNPREANGRNPRILPAEWARQNLMQLPFSNRIARLTKEGNNAARALKLGETVPNTASSLSLKAAKYRGNFHEKATALNFRPGYENNAARFASEKHKTATINSDKQKRYTSKSPRLCSKPGCLMGGKSRRNKRYSRKYL
jgi:hypothetical protein